MARVGRTHARHPRPVVGPVEPRRELGPDAAAEHPAALQTQDPRKRIELGESLAARTPASQYSGQGTQIQFDAYRQQLAHTWRPGGNRHPLNRFAIAFAKRRLGV